MAVGMGAKPGLSFIEIIISIMIIAIMTVGTFSFFKYLETAKRTRTSAALNNLQLALEQYRIHVGHFPSQLEELAHRPTDARLAKRWQGPYADERELRDAWGFEFVYRLNPKGAASQYELYSFGSKNGDASSQDQWILASNG